MAAELQPKTFEEHLVRMNEEHQKRDFLNLWKYGKRLAEDPNFAKADHFITAHVYYYIGLSAYLTSLPGRGVDALKLAKDEFVLVETEEQVDFSDIANKPISTLLKCIENTLFLAKKAVIKDEACAHGHVAKLPDYKELYHYASSESVSDDDASDIDLSEDAVSFQEVLSPNDASRSMPNLIGFSDGEGRIVKDGSGTFESVRSEDEMPNLMPVSDDEGPSSKDESAVSEDESMPDLDNVDANSDSEAESGKILLAKALAKLSSAKNKEKLHNSETVSRAHGACQSENSPQHMDVQVSSPPSDANQTPIRPMPQSMRYQIINSAESTISTDEAQNPSPAMFDTSVLSSNAESDKQTTKEEDDGPLQDTATVLAQLDSMIASGDVTVTNAATTYEMEEDM